MRKLAALAFALSSLALFAERDMAIYRGKLTSDLKANGNRITSVGSPLNPGDAANKEYVDEHVGGCDTNAVDILANAAVVTNALTVATTNRVASLDTAMDEKANSADIPGMVRETMSAEGISSSGINIGGSISGRTIRDQYGYLREAINGKADKATPYADGNLAALTADGNLKDSGKKASDFLPATRYDQVYFVEANTTFSQIYGDGFLIDASQHRFWGARFYYEPNGSEYPEVHENEIAVKGDIADAISSTNPTFSDAVLAVNLDFTTNTTGAAYVAVTNALAGFGFDAEALAELPGGKVYGSIGGLLAALAAAAAWLKKNKVQTLKLNDGSVATSADGGVAKLDDFFTESNSLLMGTIAANSARLALDEEGEIIVTMNTED